MNSKITAYKGFSADWTCRDFQYEVGQSYKHKGNVEHCVSGFHACEHPLDVFGYYPPNISRFALVELSGELSREEGGDTKVAAAAINIKAELQLPQIIEAAVKYVFDGAKPVKGSHVKKDRGAASATGDRGAASATGHQGAASATGDQGAASATGDWGAASATGHQGAASATGDRGAASATGNWGAASATGNQGAASATGDQGAASATGDWGAAMACGYEGRVSAKEGNALFLCERNNENVIVAVWAGIAGKDGVKPGTFYMLKNGAPVEVDVA